MRNKKILFRYYTPSFNGQINIPAVLGPMGKSVEDLALWLKSVTNL
jgi:hypothetical protein